MQRRSRTLLRGFVLVCAAAAMGTCGTVANAKAVARAALLAGGTAITVPLDVTSERIASFEASMYIFVSGSDGRAVLVIHFAPPTAGSFFNAHEMAGVQPFLLNGLHAWRRSEGAYVQIDVKLPTCFPTHALLVFAKGDQGADRMVSTFRAVSRCRDELRSKACARMIPTPERGQHLTHTLPALETRRRRRRTCGTATILSCTQIRAGFLRAATKAMHRHHVQRLSLRLPKQFGNTTMLQTIVLRSMGERCIVMPQGVNAAIRFPRTQANTEII